ncbi:MAG: hypothetical protein VB878_25625 [Pirellulaceae bacterium]|jgi:hypothetical protein
MSGINLSSTSCKALEIHIGEEPIRELLDQLNRLAQRVEHLERTKVDVINILPLPNSESATRKVA